MSGETSEKICAFEQPHMLCGITRAGSKRSPGMSHVYPNPPDPMRVLLQSRERRLRDSNWSSSTIHASTILSTAAFTISGRSTRSSMASSRPHHRIR